MNANQDLARQHALADADSSRNAARNLEQRILQLETVNADLLKALEAGDELWAMLPFDSGADIAEIAERVRETQYTAIDRAKEGR